MLSPDFNRMTLRTNFAITCSTIKHVLNIQAAISFVLRITCFRENHLRLPTSRPEAFLPESVRNTYFNTIIYKEL